MSKINTITITDFWGDKIVNLRLAEDVNFLIGVNGSGKTTIINLVAATLNADFATLDRFQFRTIRIDFTDRIENNKTKTAFIEVDKSGKTNSPFSKIEFKVKRYDDSKPKKYDLDELEEDHYIRYNADFIIQRRLGQGSTLGRDINAVLQDLVNVTWLSIHRITSYARRREERSHESTIDMKIEELQNDLIKYFSQLNRKYTIETEKFQKFIFESLIDTESSSGIFSFARTIDSLKEKDSLKEIFRLFKLNEASINTKLESYFSSFNKSRKKLDASDGLEIDDLSFILGTRRIHSVVQQWTNLIEKQKEIYKSKDIFLSVINNLLQRKELIINEKNELIVKTQSGKTFSLTNLSSGEKQLLIILAQSLLQESKVHIYIADEPELSLHVDWQEKLVKSLKSVNPNSQILFATHSPDIVGEFQNAVIKVEDTIK